MTVAPTGPATDGAAPLLARADRGRLRDDVSIAGAVTDLALPSDARLDDEVRARLNTLLAGLVWAVERELASHAGRLLSGTMAGERLLREAADVLPRLRAAGLLADPALVAELLGRVRQDQLAERLVRTGATEDRPSLLTRLAHVPDGVVADAARALLLADSRRRAPTTVRTELPAELHARLVWWVAAALHEHVADLPDHEAATEAITQAALRSLGAHDEGERLEAIATRLAVSIDARPDELGELLTEALGDGRSALFIAAIARAGGLDYDDARVVVLDPDGARLWLVLRAQALDRSTIARIGLALAEADPRRDLDAFADELDQIVAVTPQAARTALAPERLQPAFRQALRALARTALR